ncbi:MAG: ABC transporter substrate-binding protein [Burkholderiales bacterium]|nr:ABC transporter substrate-binding protein [Burkholderiales bacterium]
MTGKLCAVFGTASRAAFAALIGIFGTLPFTALAQGVTADSIIIGQSAALSGPAQALGQEMKAGIEAYFKHVNSKGGINGRKLVLKSLDDGYEPERAKANTTDLIEKEKVLALLGYVGTPTSNAALPVFTAAKVPFVGPFTGAQSLREPFNRYIFHVRASYFDETEAIIDHLARAGITRIGVFYQNDAYGQAGLTGVERALKKRNMQIAAKDTVERNTVDVSKSVASLSKANLQAVVMISAYKSCAAFIRAMKQADANPQFWNVSFVGSKALSDELGPEGRGVQISQVVPFPWGSNSAVVKEYQKIISPDGQDIYNFSSLEGFLAAKVLVEGIRRAGRDLTRESLVTAMEKMGKVDLGGFTVNYSPTNREGSRFVDLTIISKNGKFMR